MALPDLTWTGWGAGILETDRAMDAIAGMLSKDLDINIHFAGNPEHYHPDDPECTCRDCEHEPKARSIERTREYLDQGNFTRVFNKYKAKQNAIVAQMHTLTARETCIILTVKAMEFGAKVSPSQRSILKTMYKQAGLTREGIWQFGLALEEHINGTPYELKEPDRTDHNIYLAFEQARADVVGGMAYLSYPVVRYFEEDVGIPDPKHAARLNLRRQRGEPTWFPGAAVLRECASCLRKMHEVPEGLRACAVCKKVMYCGKDCQKSHWKTHKKHCAEFASAPPPPALDTLEQSPMLVKGFDPLGGGDPDPDVKTSLKVCPTM